jgi:hypothetical protein
VNLALAVLYLQFIKEPPPPAQLPAGALLDGAPPRGLAGNPADTKEAVTGAGGAGGSGPGAGGIAVATGGGRSPQIAWQEPGSSSSSGGSGANSSGGSSFSEGGAPGLQQAMGNAWALARQSPQTTIAVVSEASVRAEGLGVLGAGSAAAAEQLACSGGAKDDSADGSMSIAHVTVRRAVMGAGAPRGSGARAASRQQRRLCMTGVLVFMGRQ